jgi:hypothetical protein
MEEAMNLTFFKGVGLGAVVSALTLTTTAALAGTGVGGVFNLGVKNSVNGTTTLTGRVAGSQLQVTNTSARSGATGIGIRVAAGKPPLVVNSSAEVVHLNAGMVDGKPATAFLPVTGTAANSAKLGGLPASAYLSSSAGAVGRANLANSAVGPAQLGDDFMKRIDVSASYDNITDVFIGSDTYVGLNCHFSSSLLRIDLVNQQSTTMDMSLAWIDTGGASHYSAAATDFLGPDVGTSTGYFLMSNATETITGSFEAFDNGSNTCTLEGNMYRLTTAN